jgi:hypothetical protein
MWVPRGSLTAAARLAAGVLLAVTACGPRPASESSAPIDLSRAPEQTPLADPAPIHLAAGGYRFVITPLAHYVLRGVVVSEEGYHFGWNAELSPCDVAVAWGGLAANDAWRKLQWSQGGRWYFWRWHGQRPFPDAFVVGRSSNTHIVPATSALGRAAGSLSPGDIAEMTGELVAIDGRKGRERVWWKSSLSRTDTGDGSCELLYLQRLRVNGKVYE